MITFSNKSIHYNLSRQGQNFKMNGTVTITGEDSVRDLNATVYDLEDNYVGSFYYSENSDGKCTKNLNDVAKENFVAVDQFIDETLAELKLNIPE